MRQKPLPQLLTIGPPLQHPSNLAAFRRAVPHRRAALRRRRHAHHPSRRHHLRQHRRLPKPTIHQHALTRRSIRQVLHEKSEHLCVNRPRHLLEPLRRHAQHPAERVGHAEPRAHRRMALTLQPRAIAAIHLGIHIHNGNTRLSLDLPAHARLARARPADHPPHPLVIPQRCAAIGHHPLIDRVPQYALLLTLSGPSGLIGL